MMLSEAHFASSFFLIFFFFLYFERFLLPDEKKNDFDCILSYVFSIAWNTIGSKCSISIFIS